MIIQEIVVVNKTQLKHTYSSDNKYIKQVETDILYSDVYDTLRTDYHYIETDQEIIPEIEPEDVPQA